MVKDWATYWDSNQSQIDLWLDAEVEDLLAAEKDGLSVKSALELALRRGFVVGFIQAQLQD